MEFSVTKQDGVAVLGLIGRLDSSNAQDVQDKIFDIIEEGSQKFVADLSGLEYISSAGLRVFLATAKRLSGKGHIHLCCIQSQVLEVFEMSGFTAIFKIFDTKETAIAN